MSAAAAPQRGVHDRTAAFLMGMRHRRVSIITPEGVQLDVMVATYGERASAFLLDLLLITLTNIALVLAVVLIAGVGWHAKVLHGHVRLVFALTGLIAFLVRTLYFVRFELAWQGATPGKRLLGLRVIDREGGPLLPGAVVTRNITREIEVFLPLGALMTASAGGWGGLGLALWLALLAAVPLFTPTRLRAGDMLARTMVIAMPKYALLDDLAGAGTDYSFTERQLEAYGAFELQILEEILRRQAGPATEALQADVCARICKRIDWPEPVSAADTDRFLRAFYAAERANLERAQLFGRGREMKDGT